MDSLTHALFMATLCVLAGRPDLVPFAVLGAILPDVDVTFQRLSDRDPRLYIFTHGGITHSLAGATFTALAGSAIALVFTNVLVPAWAPADAAIAVVAALAGGLSHIGLDYLAYPGIPLLFPVKDRKYTLGIMAGPSIWLLAASLAYLGLVLAGLASFDSPWAYVLVFSCVVGGSALLKIYVSRKVEGTAIPGMNPLKWLAVIETPCTYIVYGYDILKGPVRGVVYEKYGNVEPARVQACDACPEFRRMRYHSYLLTAELNGDTITYRDPLREHGHVWYPPYFKNVCVPLE